MTKNIYETTGAFQLVGSSRAEHVPHNRPAVLESSHFTQKFQSTGALNVLGTVNDEATDEEFAKYWAESKGNRDLAVQSFIAAFPVETSAPKGRAKKAEPEVE